MKVNNPIRLAVTALGVGLCLLCADAARAAELLMFETRGCPWCEIWRREVGVGYPKSVEGQRAPLRRLDLSAARPPGMELSAPVTASPTFILVDRGREVGRIVGYPGADFFWAQLAELIAKLDRGSRNEVFLKRVVQQNGAMMDP